MAFKLPTRGFTGVFCPTPALVWLKTRKHHHGANRAHCFQAAPCRRHISRLLGASLGSGGSAAVQPHPLHAADPLQTIRRLCGLSANSGRPAVTNRPPCPDYRFSVLSACWVPVPSRRPGGGAFRFSSCKKTGSEATKRPQAAI